MRKGQKWLACCLTLMLCVLAVVACDFGGSGVNPDGTKETQASTQVQTELVTQLPTEQNTITATEGASEVVTDEINQIVTDADTEPITEPPNEASTENITEASTTTPTEPPTEPPTENNTETNTETSTTTPTEPPTQPPTENNTETNTETSTTAPTEPPTQPPTETPTEPPVEECSHIYANACDVDCNLCGDIREVPPHVEKTLVGRPPTCVEEGCGDGVICTVCLYVITPQTLIPATGHTEVADKAVEPTCTTGGLTEGIHCGVCDEVIKAQTSIDPTGHTEVADKAVEPTCTEDGLTEGIHCGVCDEVIKAQTAIEMLGHLYGDEYLSDDNYHWRKCERVGCGALSEKEAHTSKYVRCDVCLKKLPDIKSVHLSTSSSAGDYKCKNYAFDYLYVSGNVIAGAGTSTAVNNVNSIEVWSLDTVALRGWIGMANYAIDSFGVFIGDDIQHTFTSNGFNVDTEDAVIGAGGKYAKRFHITIDVGQIKQSHTSISFVAILTDGTFVIIDEFELFISGISEGEEMPDDQIVKAEKAEPDGSDFRAEQNGDTYTTAAGLSYTAAGEGSSFSADDGRFTITKENGLKINFSKNNECVNSTFNKYNVEFFSSSPLRIIVVYSDNGQAITDIVYLEAGENLFSCLTVGYLNGYLATNMVSMDIQVLGDEDSAQFVLYDVAVQQVPLIDQGLTYISNSRFTLGIKLAWGGGISFLVDTQDGNPSLSNLINNADTGRLIQQSYYGSSDPREYECGEYGGNNWGYNPVQGGNKYNQASRIIDVVIEQRSVYVKAQPRDWAKQELTPSYMENVYTVYSDRIQVDNRFTDYAGFKYNPVRHQELPAFYTVGFLNTFTYYNGSRPWTNGELTSHDALGFWAGNKDAYFNVVNNNTETWCAWINKATDYGVGLYTPKVKILLAGRHGYETDPDTVNPASGACSYVAPLCNLKLVSYKSLEYSYLITCGSTEEIRELFTQYKDFSDNSDLSSREFS